MKDDGFVDVIGALEPRAIAGEISDNAHHRLAEALTLAIGSLDEQGRELSELQKIELLRQAGRAFDGFERGTLNLLQFEIGRIRA